jgi:hypothetical protein
MVDSPGESRDEKYNRQTTESFAALGRFVQCFEGMVGAARDGAMFLLSNNLESQTLVKIALYHQALTAKPIMEIFRAITMRTIEFHTSLRPGILNNTDRDTFSAVLGQIHREFETLANTRNNLLHATWYIGWSNEHETDFSQFLARKERVNKSGSSAVNLPKTAAELNELSERCAEIEEWIRLVFSSLLFAGSDEGGCSIKRLFRYNKEDKRWEDARPSKNAPRT